MSRRGGPAAGGNRVTWLHNTSRHVGVTDKYGFFPPFPTLIYIPTTAPVTRTRLDTPREFYKVQTTMTTIPPIPTDHTKHNILYSYNHSYYAVLATAATPPSLQGLFHPTPMYIISLVLFNYHRSRDGCRHRRRHCSPRRRHCSLRRLRRCRRRRAPFTLRYNYCARSCLVIK